MSTFKNIPIKVERPPAPDDTEIARTVLDEVRVLLEEFIGSGQSSAVDLRQIPQMGPEAYQFLKDSLSAGEVSATIKSAGRTEIHETAYPGVWWVTHRNQKNDIVTEVIEVTEIPDILKSQPEDIRHGLRRLTQRMAVTEPPSKPSPARQPEFSND